MDVVLSSPEQKAKGSRARFAVAGSRWWPAIVVRIEPDPADDDWTVTDRLDRRNVLCRSDSRGLDESIAANLDQLAIVVAPRPPSDPFIVDRYLAGAAYAGITALLVVNKQDLPPEERELEFLADLERASLRVYRVSARSGAGLADLRSALAGQRTLLAGQSGVGKSSLFNTLSRIRRTRDAHLVRCLRRGTAHDGVLGHFDATLGRARRFPGRTRLRAAAGAPTHGAGRLR